MLLQVSFHGLDHSDVAEDYIRERADALERFYSAITACRVAVEVPHRHQRKGRVFRVRIDLTVPTGELVVGHEPEFDHAHEDLHVAIRDAFDAARRKLEDQARLMQGATKAHGVAAHGRVARLFDDYGFIATSGGDEIYFHANSVPDGKFGTLAIGSEVRYALHEGEGEKGPQASTVLPLGKHHLPNVERI